MVAPPALFGCQDDRRTIAITDHRISVPLKYTDTSCHQRLDVYFTILEIVPDLDTVDWFATLKSMTPTHRAQAYVERSALESADDMLLYLQGGPGFGAPIPMVELGLSSDSSWAAKALTYYPRIVLMDQRGTGRSMQVNKRRLKQLFPHLFSLDSTGGSNDRGADGDIEPSSSLQADFQKALQQATDFVAQFRAPSIVRDAEYIKDALMKQVSSKPNPWGAVLGQSFGGYCVSTYLSWIDHPPRICLVTGGIPPIGLSIYEVYTKLWDRLRERTRRFYEEYPGDVLMVRKIVQHLLKHPEPLGSGGTLTARRFLQYGMTLGDGPSSFASLHHRLQTAFVDDDMTELSRSFGKYFDSNQYFDDHPLYFYMREAIYANGPEYSPTAWAAGRCYQELLNQDSSLDFTISSERSDDSVTFFGDMVFPWMTEDYVEFQGHGCTELIHALANKTDWDPLYNPDHMRAVLKDGRSRMAAVVYYEDLYVEFEYSMRQTRRGGPLEKCKVLVTNEYQHSGIRDGGAQLFGKLHGMATGSNRVPS
eukprot:Nitzschia sp. Nitz4//scaffold196_size54656//331//1935//NITZ4_006627-RA/size54656-processed-gene-0.45-mRNA-1//1//CDS//3329540390//4154//frame0